MAKSLKIGLIISFIALYFVVGSSLTLAAEWDNVKNYDSSTKTVTISNSLLWLVETGEVAKIKLNSEVHRTIVDLNDYVAEFTINNYENNYNGFIKEIEFYDYYKYKKGIVENKQGSFTYKYYDPDYTTTRTIDITEEKCIDNPDNKNNTKVCSLEVTGTRLETYKGAWLDFNEKNPLPIGEILLRAYYHGDIKQNERIEFVPTFFGVRITEWLDFGTAVPYERQDLSSSFGNEDGFGQTFTVGVNGTNVTHTFKGFSMWFGVFGGARSQCRYILTNVTPAGQPNMTAINLVKFTDCSEVVESDMNNMSFASDIILQKGATYFFGFNVTGTTLQHSYYTTADSYRGGNDYFMAGTGGAWVEQSNIDDRFIEWGEQSTIPSLTINLNLPPTGTNSINTTYIFNANVSVSSYNLTNATLFIWLANKTINTTKLNNTFVGNNISTWNVTLGIANYTWNVFVCGTNSSSTLCNMSISNYTLNVTFISTPSIIVTNPNGRINYYVGQYSNLTLNMTTTNNQSCWLSYLNFTNITNQYQYQETADEISVTAGNIYVNYTKPVTATNKSIWQIKINETTMNITLNNSCWDYLPNKLLFNLYSVYDDYGTDRMISKAYCKNSTDWIELAQANVTYPSSTLATGNVAKRLYDGNWTRGATYDNYWLSWLSCGAACPSNLTFFYEEAIYWVEDKSLSCTATSFYPYTSNYARFYVNNSIGITNSTLTSWYYSIKENSISYNASSITGNRESFVLNLSYDTSYYSSISVYFNYNNTVYTTSQSGTGGNLIYTSSIYTPAISNSANKTFYWIISLSNSTAIDYFNSTKNNQTINPISIDNCTGNNRSIINFTLYDEDSRTLMNGSLEISIDIYSYLSTDRIVTFNSSYTNTAKATICLSQLNSTYTMQYKVRYYNDTSVSEYKYGQGITIDNSTNSQIINLYDLVASRSTSFVINVKGSDLSILSGVIVDIQRQYIPINQFISVESPITDSNGKTIAHLVAKEGVYNFIITSNGNILGTFNNYIVKCQNELTSDCSIDLNIAQATNQLDDYSNYGNLSVNYELDKDARTVQLSYIATDSQTHTITFNAIKNNNTFCSQSSQGTSGSLSCDIPQTYGNMSFYTEIYSDGNLVGFKSFDLSASSSDIFGGTKVVLGLLMYSTITLIFIGHPVMIIIGSILGIAFAGAFHIVDGGTFFGNATIISFFLIAGGILIYIISKKT